MIAHRCVARGKYTRARTSPVAFKHAANQSRAPRNRQGNAVFLLVVAHEDELLVESSGSHMRSAGMYGCEQTKLLCQWRALEKNGYRGFILFMGSHAFLLNIFYKSFNVKMKL